MKPTTRLIPLLLATAVFAGCENPVGVEEEEGHPAGLVVLDAQGTQVARFQGVAASGRVEVRLGAPATFTVRVLDEDGAPLTVDGSQLSLAVTASGGVATAALTAGTTLAVTPARVGTGELRLTVSHDGHPEFAAPFPLVVAP